MSCIDALIGDFTIKDSGQREDFDSGMRRDMEEGKIDYTLLFDGVIADRYAAHLTKGAQKYGPRNWMLACTAQERDRFRRSASRHFRQWLRGDRDEDHASAVAFNVFAAEYVQGVLDEDPGCLAQLEAARALYESD